MKNINPFKIYLLSIFHLIMPKWIRHRFHFKASPIEHLAVGTMMSKIKYWRHFIRKHYFSKEIHFRKIDEKSI